MSLCLAILCQKWLIGLRLLRKTAARTSFLVQVQGYPHYISGNSMQKNSLVFVYGTLRMGQANHYLLQREGASLIGKGKTSIKYRMFAAGVPFISNAEHAEYKKLPRTQIVGELYSVTPEVLRSLDRLEGHPLVYERRFTQVILDGQTRRIRAWLYFYDDASGYYIPDGDFVTFSNECMRMKWANS